MKKNVWLLTEERPKTLIIETILKRFCGELNFRYEVDHLKILPIISKDGKFQFCYKATGFNSTKIKDIFILPVSGHSSFVDYMLFYQDECPSDKDHPLFLIEETKTDDKESRNTGVYQRGSKFIFSEFFYPKTKKIMLYNVILQKDKPTLTYIFGTRMLLTLGVEIIGKNLDAKIFKPFKNIDELIKLKNDMPSTRNGVSVKLKKEKDAIYVSGRLEKGGKLASDPSIGTLTLIGSSLRKLGWQGRIIITQHGLKNKSAIGNDNKFNQIAHKNKIELENLNLPKLKLPTKYWKREIEREKTGTIFVHVISENLVEGISIYENHGGCERGYFIDYNTGKNPLGLAVKKYTDRAKYKAGDKSFIVFLPDLVILDKKRKEIINIEGKTYKNKTRGILELNNFPAFEKGYIEKYYKAYKIKRGLVLAGTGDTKTAKEIKELMLYLDNEGKIILGKNAPSLIKEAVLKLKSLKQI